MAIAVGMEWAGLLQLTINFTGNGGFNPKLDIRYFDRLSDAPSNGHGG